MLQEEITKVLKKLDKDGYTLSVEYLTDPAKELAGVVHPQGTAAGYYWVLRHAIGFPLSTYAIFGDNWEPETDDAKLTPERLREALNMLLSHYWVNGWMNETIRKPEATYNLADLQMIRKC